MTAITHTASGIEIVSPIAIDADTHATTVECAYQITPTQVAVVKIRRNASPYESHGHALVFTLTAVPGTEEVAVRRTARVKINADEINRFHTSIGLTAVAHTLADRARAVASSVAAIIAVPIAA